MTLQQTVARPTSGRRVGYVLGALANAALLWMMHVWPGWEVVPFLNADTPQVLGLVDASLVAGIVVNLVHLVCDPGWSIPAGQGVTTAFGLAATIRVLDVFPFDLGSGWATVVHVLLVVGIAGSVIGLVAALVCLAHMLGSTRAPGHRTG
jgi:hypothetical protein